MESDPFDLPLIFDFKISLPREKIEKTPLLSILKSCSSKNGYLRVYEFSKIYK